MIPAQRWWVVFEASKARRWWKIFTRPGFDHCWAFTTVSPGQQLVLAPNEVCCHGLVASGPASDLIVPAVASGARVVTVRRGFAAVPQDGPESLWFLPRLGWLVTCASVISYHLGLEHRGITPWSLYRALIDRYGAEEVHLGRSS